MSTTIAIGTLLVRACAPILKDIYSGTKGSIQSAFSKWNLESAAKKVAKKLDEIDKVRTIWSPEESLSLRSFYYPSRVNMPNEGLKQINTINDLGKECVVLQGIVGQGKSMLMRYLAVQEVCQSETPRLPIFLELRKVTRSSNLIQSIKNVLSTFGIDATDEAFSYLAHSGKMVLLLDGFDEIETDLTRSVTLEVEFLNSTYENLQIIASSRPNNEIQKLSSFRVIQITTLSEQDYDPFLQKLNIEKTRIAEITKAIKNSPTEISDLITTPLMLTLVALVYQSEQQIPRDLPEFFDNLFHTVFTRHDRIKPAFERRHYSGLSERRLRQLFEAFCFMCLQAGHSRSVARDQFSEAFELAQTYTEQSQCTEANFKKDITKVACLMLDEGVNDSAFLHKSIAEYHAASYIKGADDTFAARFFEEAAKDIPTWNETLRFLENIDSFRFAKYFAIAQLTNALEIVSSLCEGKDGLAIQQALPPWCNNLYITFRKGTSGDTFLKHSFGHWYPQQNYFLGDLGETISLGFFQTIPVYASDNELKEIVANCPNTRQTGTDIAIPLTTAINHWGIDELKLKLLSLSLKIESQLETARALATKLTKRALIFDRPPRKS